MPLEFCSQWNYKCLFHRHHGVALQSPSSNHYQFIFSFNAVFQQEFWQICVGESLRFSYFCFFTGVLLSEAFLATVERRFSAFLENSFIVFLVRWFGLCSKSCLFYLCRHTYTPWCNHNTFLWSWQLCYVYLSGIWKRHTSVVCHLT